MFNCAFASCLCSIGLGRFRFSLDAHTYPPRLCAGLSQLCPLLQEAVRTLCNSFGPQLTPSALPFLKSFKPIPEIPLTMASPHNKPVTTEEFHPLDE